MSAPRPIEMLDAEHRVILKIVGVLGVLADALDAGKPVQPRTLRDLVEFMRTFADKCHHGKEEAHLFPALASRGVPTQGCPIGGLMHEHQKGRALVAELAQAIETHVIQTTPEVQAVIVRCLRDLAVLYTSHIWKEDYLLFPMSGKVLSEADNADLQRKFEAVEAEIGCEVHHRLEALAEKLQADAKELVTV
jgi:hemerythrin-like domain-containing protein